MPYNFYALFLFMYWLFWPELCLLLEKLLSLYDFPYPPWVLLLLIDSYLFSTAYSSGIYFRGKLWSTTTLIFLLSSFSISLRRCYFAESYYDGISTQVRRYLVMFSQLKQFVQPCQWFNTNFALSYALKIPASSRANYGNLIFEWTSLIDKKVLIRKKWRWL